MHRPEERRPGAGVAHDAGFPLAREAFLATYDLAFLMELNVDPFAAKLVSSQETP